jgi:tight adherence protein B
MSERREWLRFLRAGRTGMVCAVLAGAAVGTALSGPVAAAVCATYAAFTLHLVRRQVRQRAQAQSRTRAVDAVAGIAAELRAGLPVTSTLFAGIDDDTAVAARARAALAVAETSGAPLADLLDRLDADLRAADHTAAMVRAHAAGARASAALLAVLPIAGAGLGTLIGIDPAHALLHTTLGAACLMSAVLLQVVGVEWTARLCRVEVPV